MRFTSPVYVPADEAAAVEFTGKVKSVDPETRKTAVIAIVAKSGQVEKIFGRGHGDGPTWPDGPGWIGVRPAR